MFKYFLVCEAFYPGNQCFLLCGFQYSWLKLPYIEMQLVYLCLTPLLGYNLDE